MLGCVPLKYITKRTQACVMISCRFVHIVQQETLGKRLQAFPHVLVAHS
jgi:hypothetical protein